MLKNNHTVKYLLLYIGNILCFACLYSFVDLKSDYPLEFYDYIYLSVVTVTTLGYGEITPISFPAKAAAICQSLSGIFLFGFALNSIWKDYSDRERRAFEQNIEAERKKFASKSLTAHSKILAPKVSDHIQNLFTATTDLCDQFTDYHVIKEGQTRYSTLVGIDEQVNSLKTPIEFSKIVNVFEPSYKSMSGFRPFSYAVLDYFESESVLKKAIQDFLAINNFEFHERINMACLAFLSNSSDESVKSDIEYLLVHNASVNNFLAHIKVSYKKVPELNLLIAELNKSRVALINLFECLIEESQGHAQ